jgi:hypothetical protein
VEYFLRLSPLRVHIDDEDHFGLIKGDRMAREQAVVDNPTLDYLTVRSFVSLMILTAYKKKKK